MNTTTTTKPTTAGPATTAATPWLTVDQCLHELGIPRSTWEKWRQRRVAPKAKRLPNGQLRVRRDWLDQWLENLPENL
jgi:hypothetical protein